MRCCTRRRCDRGGFFAIGIGPMPTGLLPTRPDPESTCPCER